MEVSMRYDDMKTLVLKSIVSLVLGAAMLGGTSCEDTQRASRRHAALADADGDGVADRIDQCPGSGSGFPVNDFGCRDSDEDGVTDEDDQCPNTESGQVVDSTGCDYVGAGGRPGGEVYRPRIVSGAEYERDWWARFVRVRDEACPDDSVGPHTPRVTYPAIWSVELTTLWTAPSTPLTITWTAVSDDCEPIVYGIDVERKDLATGVWHHELLLSTRRLTATSHQVDWPEDTWGRYRVWSTDANGQSSEPTAWRYFRFATADVPLQDRFRDPAYK